MEDWGYPVLSLLENLDKSIPDWFSKNWKESGLLYEKHGIPKFQIKSIKQRTMEVRLSHKATYENILTLAASVSKAESFCWRQRQSCRAEVRHWASRQVRGEAANCSPQRDVDAASYKVGHWPQRLGRIQKVVKTHRKQRVLASNLVSKSAVEATKHDAKPPQLRLAISPQYWPEDHL